MLPGDSATDTHAVADDGLSVVPGAVSVHLKRTLPSGLLVEFEAAPAGFLKADGMPRRRDHRAYYINRTPEVTPKARQRVESVTTICDRILPKDGLPPWSERQGIRGTLEALRRGLLTPDTSDDDAVAIVRGNDLGANAARDEAADRGLNIHALLEAYMRWGVVPNPADHPEPHRPFIRGIVKWIIHCDPQPEAVELLVADPDDAYAGRLDLLARLRVKSRAKTMLVDLKTQEKGAIYESAHVQVQLYRRAEERHGEHAIHGAVIVVVDGFGNFREMDVIADAELAERALAYYRPIKRITAACEQVNRIVRKSLEEQQEAAA